MSKAWSGATRKEEQVRFLVNSEATYMLLSEKVWKPIELRPRREHSFTLADEAMIKRKVSECYIILPQGEAHTSNLRS